MPKFVNTIKIVTRLAATSLLFAAVNYGHCATDGAGAAERDRIIALALERKLYDNPYWDILLHYDMTMKGRRSRIDDPDFFISETGKTDPKAELTATITAIFDNRSTAGDASLPCRYIGRFSWLDTELGLFAALGEQIQCIEFEETFDKLDPHSVTLVFPGSFMNNPASMFGHTMLTVNSAAKSRLLSYAVSYSATGTDNTGLLFALRGLLGMYPGYFSLLPYYEKVQEYSDISQRDIWEYQLNLNQTEIRRLLLHLWELRGIHSDYYFFTENCSYNLLFLLDAARPSLQLHRQFRAWVMPIDTVKTANDAGLIDSALYRPSRATKISRLVEDLDNDQMAAVLQVLNGATEPAALVNERFGTNQQIQMLDAVIETAQYHHAKRDWDKARYLPVFLSASKLRSQLGNAGRSEVTIEPPARPDKGHGTRSISIGLGFVGDNGFVDVELRPAYHDFLDPPEGYGSGSQISFLKSRFEIDGNNVSLDRLDFINILSLVPRDPIFRPLSWKLKSTLFRGRINGDRHRILSLNAGVGLSREAGAISQLYGLLQSDVRIGGALDNSFGLGIGVAGGIVTPVSPRWNLHARLDAIHYGLGHEHDHFSISVDNGYRLNDRATVIVEIARQLDFRRYETISALNCRVYF